MRFGEGMNPVGQMLHCLAPVSSKYCPKAHSLQMSVLVFSAYLPASHFEQSGRPAGDAYLPGMHEMHFVKTLLSSSLAKPTGQNWHPPSANSPAFPAGQAEHLDNPFSFFV